MSSEPIYSSDDESGYDLIDNTPVVAPSKPLELEALAAEAQQQSEMVNNFSLKAVNLGVIPHNDKEDPDNSVPTKANCEREDDWAEKLMESLWENILRLERIGELSNELHLKLRERASTRQKGKSPAVAASEPLELESIGASSAETQSKPADSRKEGAQLPAGAILNVRNDQSEWAAMKLCLVVDAFYVAGLLFGAHRGDMFLMVLFLIGALLNKYFAWESIEKCRNKEKKLQEILQSPANKAPTATYSAPRTLRLVKEAGRFGILCSDGSTKRVSRLIPGSPAEKAGLKEGDVIVFMNSFDLASVSLATFSAMLKDMNEIELVVLPSVN